MFNESEAPFFPRFGVGFFVCLFVFVFVFVFCFEVAGIEMIKLNKIKKSSTFKVHECIGLWAGHSSSCSAIEFGKGTKNTCSSNHLNYPSIQFNFAVKRKGEGRSIGRGDFFSLPTYRLFLYLFECSVSLVSPVLELEMTRLSFSEKIKYYF